VDIRRLVRSLKFKSDSQRKAVFSRMNRFALYVDDKTKRVRSDVYPQVDMTIKPIRGESLSDVVSRVDRFEPYLGGVKNIKYGIYGIRGASGTYKRDPSEDLYDDSFEDNPGIGNLYNDAYINMLVDKSELKNLPTITIRKMVGRQRRNRETGAIVDIDENREADATLAHEIGHHLDFTSRTIPFKGAMMGGMPNDEVSADAIAIELYPGYDSSRRFNKLADDEKVRGIQQAEYAIALKEQRTPSFKELAKYAGEDLDDV
jgi:hypothetical protein